MCEARGTQPGFQNSELATILEDGEMKSKRVFWGVVMFALDRTYSDNKIIVVNCFNFRFMTTPFKLQHIQLLARRDYHSLNN